MSAASPTMIPVPTMALATPPPDWPAGTGFLVKKSQLSDDAPLAIRSPRISTSASTAVNDNTATRPVIRPLVTWRRRLRELTGRGLPPRGPHPERGLALAGGDRQEHLAGHGGDVGDDHNREDDAAGEQRVAVEHPAEQRRPAQCRAQRWHHVAAQERDQDEDTPQPV